MERLSLNFPKLGPGPYEDERKRDTFQLIILCIPREDRLGLVTSNLCHRDFLVIIDRILERRDKIFFFSLLSCFSHIVFRDGDLTM